jgi:hypothetical protein
MNVTFLSIATFFYFLTAASNLKQRDYPMALLWFSYTVANCSLIWYEARK